MKTLFTSLALLLFISTATFAQPLKIGVRGGVNTSSYDFQRFSLNGTAITPRSSQEMGYQLGVAMRLSIPKFLQFQPELMYSTRNYGYELTTKSGVDRVKITTKRMELPFMVGFNIKFLRLFAGPVFVLSSSQSNNNKDSGFSVKFDDSDIAFQMGAGLDIRKFFLDVRYTKNFQTTYNTMTLKNVSYKSKIRNDELWAFSAGFFF